MNLPFTDKSKREIKPDTPTRSDPRGDGSWSPWDVYFNPDAEPLEKTGVPVVRTFAPGDPAADRAIASSDGLANDLAARVAVENARIKDQDRG